MHESLEQLELIEKKLIELRKALGILSSRRGTLVDNTAGLSGTAAAQARKLSAPSIAAANLHGAISPIRRARRKVIINANANASAGIQVSRPKPDLDCLITVTLDAAKVICALSGGNALSKAKNEAITKAADDLRSLLPATPFPDPGRVRALGGESSSSLEVIPSISWS